MHHITFNVIDLETTGFDKEKDKVVSAASVKVSTKAGILDTYYILVNPGIAICPESSAIHHITDKMVAGKPSLDTIIDNLKGGDCLVAHNAEFDTGFVGNFGMPVLCTMRLARKLWPDLTHTKNQFLRYYWNLEVGEVGMAHNALADAVVTAHVLLFELAELNKRAKDSSNFDLNKLIEWVNAPMLLSKCRFGNKHFGQPWSEVPKSYLKWMTEKVTDMDRDTRHTVEYWLAQ